MSALTDSFNRRLTYLRLSVTDLCNYRCTYCLPDGYIGKAKPDELTLPEIETLAQTFARSGTRKIRLTGGEPTLRRDLADIIAICRAQPQIESVALTTNAFKLAKLFPLYRAAGIDKLNISIDSFDPEVFYQITGKRECNNIVRALDGILEQGFYDIKVNTLLLRRYMSRTLADALDFVRHRPVTLRQTTFFCRYHRSRPASRRLAIDTAFGTCRPGTGIPPSRFRRRHRFYRTLQQRFLPKLQPAESHCAR